MSVNVCATFHDNPLDNWDISVCHYNPQSLAAIKAKKCIDEHQQSYSCVAPSLTPRDMFFFHSVDKTWSFFLLF